MLHDVYTNITLMSPAWWHYRRMVDTPAKSKFTHMGTLFITLCYSITLLCKMNRVCHYNSLGNRINVLSIYMQVAM